jgi:translocation and assembly module TamB
MHRAVSAQLKAWSTTILFLVSLAAGLVLHLDVPAVRRMVVAAVNRALAPTLVGKVTIERVDRLGPTGVDGLVARVDDPDGRLLLRLEGVRGHISLFALLRTLVSDNTDIVVHLPDIAVARAEVHLDADEDGTLRLVRAFTVPNPSSPSTPGKGVHLTLSRILIEHALVQGQMRGAPPLDADVDDLDGTFNVSPGELAVHIGRARLVGRGLPGGTIASGSVETHLAQPSPRGGDRALAVVWNGSVGAIAESGHFSYDAGDIDAAVDVPVAKPDHLRAFWAGCPLTETLSAHAEAHGKLNDFHVLLGAKLGSSTIAIDGPVAVGDDIKGNLHVGARAVDLHAFAATAPRSTLDADGTLSFAAATAGTASGHFGVDFHGGAIEGASVPPFSLAGEFSRDASGVKANAKGTVQEKGAPIDVTLNLAPVRGAPRLTFVAHAPQADLAGIPRLGTGIGGRVGADAHGSIDFGLPNIDAYVEASASDIRVSGVHLGSGTANARVSGPLASPVIDAEVDGGDLDVASLRFATAHAEAHGTTAKMPVKLSLSGDRIDVEAEASVSTNQGGTLRDVAVSLAKHGERAEVHASLVKFSKTEAQVDDAIVEGLGSPLRASLHKTPGTLRVVAHTRGIDLARVARLAEIEGVGDGRLRLDVDAVVRGNTAQGHASFGLSHAVVRGWDDLNAHVDVQVDGRRISGQATASAGNVGNLDVQTAFLEVGGSDALSWSSWKRTWGAIDLQSHVDLAKLAEHLHGLPFEKLSGALDVKGRFERDSLADDTPALDFLAATSHLVVTLQGTPSPLQIDGVDAMAHVRIDGSTGKTTIDAGVSDASGSLASLSGKSDSVPYGKLFASSGGLEDILRTVPFQVSLSVPERDLDALPTGLRPRAVHGLAAGTVTWSGSMVQPTIDLKGTLRNSRTELAAIALPADLELSGHYESPRADATIVVNSHDREVLRTTAHVDVAATDLLAGLDGAPVPWVGALKAHVTRFPLQSIGALDTRQVTGQATGDFAIDGLHEDARATLALDVESLRVGELNCRSVRVQSAADGRAIEASAHLDEEDGSAAFRARLGTHWGRDLTPSIDASQPAEIAFTAQQLRAELLLPFLAGTFSELDGRVTGSVGIQIDPRARTLRPQGELALTNGTFQLATIGGEFHDASAQLVVTPDGVVQLQNVSARGVSGRIEAAATARFNGLAFGGARGVVRIPQKEPMPLIVDGVQVGTVDANLDVAIDPAPAANEVDVTVNASKLHLELPAAASHDVQALNALDGVGVGIQHGPNEFVPMPIDDMREKTTDTSSNPVKMKVAVHLGKDVEVRRGTTLAIRMEGGPTITLGAGEPRAQGQIKLVRGTIDVEGKSFEIQQGSTVTFVDDPTNPQVVLTAAWKAPDDVGTTVFADFIGPLKTGKVTLRSEPPLPKNQVLALILNGTTESDSAPGASSSPNANAAAGVAGGAATAPINRALGGVNRMLDNFGVVGGISTKIDTSTTNPRPEVELQIARDISVQVAWVLGNPPPGTNPDSTLLTLSWRFLRKWSLMTTVGDAGTSIVDLVWQQRY